MSKILNQVITLNRAEFIKIYPSLRPKPIYKVHYWEHGIESLMFVGHPILPIEFQITKRYDQWIDRNMSGCVRHIHNEPTLNRQWRGFSDPSDVFLWVCAWVKHDY